MSGPNYAGEHGTAGLPGHLTIAELITNDLVLIEDALLERLSPSLKRAASDILGWFMAFAKVVTEADPKVHRFKTVKARRKRYQQAFGDLIASLKASRDIVSDFAYEGSGDLSRFLFGLSLAQVPSYWRLTGATRINIVFELRVIRGNKFTQTSSSGSFNAQKDPAYLRIKVSVWVPYGLTPKLLPYIKPEAVDTIYHELQHLYQAEREGAYASWHPEEKEKYRAALKGGGDPRHYYLAPTELDAVATSLYRLARNQRKPLEDVLVSNLQGTALSRTVRAMKDPAFIRDYAAALIGQLGTKYPLTRGQLDLDRVVQKATPRATYFT